MKKIRFILMFLCIAVGTMGLYVQPAMAARNVDIDVNPQTSNGGTVPDITPAVNPINVEYLYTRFVGQSVTDTIPVQLCMTGYDTSSPVWTSIDVSFGSAGGNLSVVSLPSNQTFYRYSSGTTDTTTPDCHILYIGLATGPLNTVQNYIATFNVSSANPSPINGNGKPNITFADVKNFKITVVVLEPGASNVSCFLTNSEGMFLTNCNSELVTESESDDGRFAIVANKKNIEVATNPGQFYFNFVWFNSTAGQQTVDVNFVKDGVIPQGANAIHSAVFAGDLSTVNPTVFDATNSIGIPDGADDQALGIVVPAGYSLLVTYHLKWEDLGELVPGGCATECGSANQFFEVTGTVSGTGVTEESCTTTAAGYKK